jgi:Peptidase family M28/PA domain
MSRILTTVVFVSLFLGAGAQQKKKVKLPDPGKFAATITTEDLSRHLYIVAGKEMEGRETASEGQRKAAAYIEQHFRSLGLKPGNGASYQQSFPVFKDVSETAELMVNGKSFEVNKDFLPFSFYNTSAKAHFSEVVFAGHGIAEGSVDDYAGLNVTGKAVLLLDGAPAGFKPATQGWRNAASVYGKIAAARAKGAAAVIISAKGFPRRAAGGGQQYTDLYKTEQYPNTFTVSDAVAKAIAGGDSCWNAWVNAGKSGKVQGTVIKANVKLAYDKKTEELSSSNVLAYLEGSDKSNEWLVISAHYDHLGKRGDVIYYGADDDGSGTVGVLEIAEAFVKAKQEGKGPRRNILFLAVSGEEKGLWGSEYFSEHPTIPMDKTTADLNIDMIGRTDTERLSPDTLNYVYVVGDDKLSSELKPISETVNAKYTKLALDYKFNDPKDPNRIYYRSDHFNFANKGVPIIFYYDGMLKADYHKATDTPDKINYPLLAKRAQLVFHTAWEMANREEMLKRDIPLN